MSSNLNAQNHPNSQTTPNQSDSAHDQQPVLAGAAAAAESAAEPSEEDGLTDSENNRTGSVLSAKIADEQRTANGTANGSANHSGSNAVNISNGNNLSGGNGCNSSKQNKVEKIRECINQCLSDKSRKKISGIINNVVELSDVEKVYLYLNLPTGAQETENSKLGPGNPFGKKADIDISQTYIWIQSHLEEDSTVSLPKAEVYEEYKNFCESNLTPALCVADFGKAMKQIFPKIKPRRLGQRGNSRYCYSGLRKKVSFERPELPDLYPNAREHDNELSPTEPNGEATQFNESARQENNADQPNRTTNDLQLEQQISQHADKNVVLSACAHVVLEWARKQLSLKLTSIKDLAKHLIQLNHIDKESMAALMVIASEDDEREEQFNFNQMHDLVGDENSVLAGRLDKKNLEVLRSGKNKSDQNNLTFKKLLESEKARKDRQGKKRTDKEQLAKLIKKQQLEVDGKLLQGRVLKAKKNRIKKEKLKAPAKIKLESFDDLTNKLTFNSNDKSLSAGFLALSNEINKTKNLAEPTSRFIDNTQLDSNQIQKRRHSYGCPGPLKADQLDELALGDGNYKGPPQIKRQTSEQCFQWPKKRFTSKLAAQHSNGWRNQQQQQQQMNQQTTDDLNSQSTNYLAMNEPTAKNNPLVTFKKYFDLNPNKTTGNANLAQQQQSLEEERTKVDLGAANNDQLFQAAGMQAGMSSPSVLNNQTISTQVGEQELYQFNMFENGNQTPVNPSMNSFNANEIYTTKNGNLNNSLINQQTIVYSELVTNMNQNQIIGDKVDFNNNLSTNTPGSMGYPYNGEDQIQLANNCQMSGTIGGNPQMANQLSDQSNQKMFLNPPLITNKSSTMSNNRALTRMRSCSGPSQCYSSTPYNNFLSNSNLSGIRSNSLTPLYEDQKMTDYGTNGAMINKFSFEQKGHYASNPVSPISEPMSPNFNSLFDKKHAFANNLRFNKFNGLGSTKKDGSRSASFTSSNSNEPFQFANHRTTTTTRQRHTSSPYVSTISGNYSYSSQSLTNSPTTLTPFNSSSELYVQQNNQGNLNLQENSFVPKNYPFPPSPPLSSNILGEEKTFKMLKQESQLTNQQAPPPQLPVMMSMEGNLQPAFNQSTTIQPAAFEQSGLIDNSSSLSNRLAVEPVVDDLQTTLQDLKDYDNEFSRFF